MCTVDMNFFNKLNESGKYIDAYIVIKNYFNKNRSNETVFLAFVELGLKLASLDIAFGERKGYLNEVSNALAIYTDWADINQDSIVVINDVTKRIGVVYEKIIEDEKVYIQLLQKAEAEKNSDILRKLAEENEVLKKVTSQKEFDDKLRDITVLEESLNKDSFTKNQQISYDTLTKHYSETISQKMEELHNLELIKINEKAVKSFKKAFDLFTEQKTKYKTNESSLKNLVTSSLFAFDSRELFNETLVYYNHIYSMIFNEVSDEMKYKLTEWSIGASKIRK